LRPKTYTALAIPATPTPGESLRPAQGCSSGSLLLLPSLATLL